MKKRLLIISLSILLVFLISFIIIYNNRSNKLKRFLENNDYQCTELICRINKDNTRYDVNIESGMFKVLTITYEFSINDDYYEYIDYTNNRICKYSVDNYKKGLLVDDSFEFEDNCNEYVNTVNEFVNQYNELFKKSKVSVDSFEK